MDLSIKSKTCTKCGEEKPLEQFYKRKGSKDGYRADCKNCQNKISKKNYIKKKEERCIYAKKYREKNPEKCQHYYEERRKKHRNELIDYSKKWRSINPEKHVISQKKYRERNPEKIKICQRKNYIKHREKRGIATQRYKKENPTKVKFWARRYMKKMLKKPGFRLSALMSVGIRRSLKGNKGGLHWESLVNYTQTELRKHLEGLFTPGMTWENMGEWHIDHIIPINHFKFESYKDVEFRMCWRLENLQPLWASDNLSKGAKILKVA